MARRENGHMLYHIFSLAGQRVCLGDPVDLVPEEFHSNGQVAHIGQIDLHHIAPHAELVAGKVHVIAFVLQGDQPFAQLLPAHFHARPQADDHAAVINGVAQAVNAGNAGHNDHIPPFRQRRRGRMAQAIDLIIDGTVLFNVGVGGRDVRLGLIIVVVRNKILHRIVRKKLAEFRAELGRQSFVVGQHQRGAVYPGNHVGHGKGFAAAGYTQQGLGPISGLNAFYEGINGLRLIAGRLIRCHQLEFAFLHFLLHLCPSRPIGP